LGEVRKKLETMEREETSKKRNNEDDPEKGKNRGRKIGSLRIDGGKQRQNGQHSRLILQVVGKFSRDEET